MLGIRQKILLGLLGILVIASLVAVQSIVQFRHLGHAIDVILRENFRSVRAAQEMKEALERMDSGALYILAGLSEKGAEQIDAYKPRFLAALEAEHGNITLPGEAERAHIISERYAEYERALVRLAAATGSREAMQALYFDTLLPLFNEIKQAAESILAMNQANMDAANDAARAQAAEATHQMYVFLAGAIAIAICFVLLTNRWILQPIEQLNLSAREIARGNLDLVVSPGSRDELGQLAATFNEMAANLRELRRSDHQQVVRSRLAAEEVFRNLPAPVAMVDLGRRVELATPSAERLFALRPGDWLDAPREAWIREIFDSALRRNAMVEPREPGVIQRFDDGRELFFKPVAAPMHNAARQQTGVLLVFHNVTQLREQEELKHGVIATVSHQLKTPLTSIRMALHLLLDERLGMLSPKQEELILAARDDSERLWRIIEDLLSIGRISSGKDLLNLQPAEPERLIGDAIEEFESAARDKGLRLEAEIESGLSCVLVDPERIAHVFRNLVANAIYYTDPGGRITVGACGSADGGVRFEVRDNGPGIANEHLARVFEQFYRVPGQPKSGGAGLGLAIVREIVHAHSGETGVESAAGAGATFWFSLPKTAI